MKNIIFFSKMNGNFRKPEYVKRYEYNNFDLETPLNAIVPIMHGREKIITDLSWTIPQKPIQLIGTTLIWKLTFSL